MTANDPSEATDFSTSSASADERAAVVQAALDYFEGWFEGDAARMERALHPELAKRSLGVDDAGAEKLDAAPADWMIEATRNGVGRSRGQGDRRIEVQVEDVYGEIANVTMHSTVYHEYLHLARTRNGWKIVNALWQPTE